MAEKIIPLVVILLPCLSLGLSVTENEKVAEVIPKAKDVVVSLLTAKDVVVIIRNMHESSSRKKAEEIKADLVSQSQKLYNVDVSVHMLHEGWAPVNAWTILPIFPWLHTKYGANKKWFFFCEDTTELSLKGLLNVLSKFDHTKELFLGHALHDEEMAIIHHFAFHDDPSSFKFPDFDAGWAISAALLKRSCDRLTATPPGMGFSIDVKHEVAMYFRENGTLLTNVPEFCINLPLKSHSCVSTINKPRQDCGIADANKILIAVKTCEKFHGDRVPVIKKTLALHAKHIRYYSDTIDKSIPTEFIGVANTERGHCQKLYNIIKKSTEQEQEDISWLVVVDDDTIMNFKRLQQILSCYNPNEPILLGERYGYGVNFKNFGYSYPTGGGGMALSKEGVRQLMSSGCICQSADAPDDMWLGSCFRQMAIPMVHTNSFHQARPSQYNRQFLSHRYLISFHKHYMIDPLQVYRDYLEDEEDKEHIPSKKTEL